MKVSVMLKFFIKGTEKSAADSKQFWKPGFGEQEEGEGPLFLFKTYWL